jgi:hypothetical protein
VEVPGYPVTGSLLGIVSGTLLGAYRIATGAADIAFTPLWVVPTLSPEARIELLVIEPSKKEKPR